MAHKSALPDKDYTRIDSVTHTLSDVARKRTTSNAGYALFLVPGVLLFLLLIIMPLLANIGISFTRWTGVGTPVWIGFANYRKAFGDSIFWISFKNNLSLIIAMTIIPTCVGLFLAAFLFDYIAKKFGPRVVSAFCA